ncbi:hypothetical protein FOS14_14265 [Skermania sp. ID1734]|uniref:hypothetical protein n=1 Tax=Skermania sp. ID1734 TaxID=2597516 RepID=UPI00117E9F14|nr:hypothetical protein [Skermania sp. ID1734]TSD98146.1 hypothetical protein FOS14_14265 [Skermania sp. ID1734]
MNRWWAGAAICAGVVLGSALADQAMAWADPHDTSDEPMMMCPAANGWRAASDGPGILVTLFENGPASVTVTVSSATDTQNQTATVPPGDSSARIAFPRFSPDSVRDVVARSIGPGPLPAQCMVMRAQ